MASTKYFNTIFPIRWFNLINGGTLNNFLNVLLGSVEDGITATAGGTKAAAYPLTSVISRLSTVTTNGDSALLPAKPYVGQIVQIINDGAANASLYGANSDTIDGNTTATATTLTAGNRAFFSCTGVSSGNYAWRSQGSGKSS